MKKLFFAALATVAVLFASCEKIEPTAVNPESLTSSAKVTGFVQYEYVATSKGETKTNILSKQEVTVLRGTLVGEKISYVAYKTTTDVLGFYQIEIPVAPGQEIVEVKVLANYKGNTYYKNQEGKLVSGDALFSAEASAQHVPAGIVTNINLLLTPAAYVDQPAQDAKPE